MLGRSLAQIAAAKALIDAEQIGEDSVTDYLSISFSAVDAVNHFFGPSSLENEDVVVQLDRTLAAIRALATDGVTRRTAAAGRPSPVPVGPARRPRPVAQERKELESALRVGIDRGELRKLGSSYTLQEIKFAD